MAKLVDALPSGGSVRKDVQVRILFWAQKSRFSNETAFFIYLKRERSALIFHFEFIEKLHEFMIAFCRAKLIR